MNQRRTAQLQPRTARPQPQAQQNRGASVFDALNRLVEVEAEIERMEAEAQNLRDRIKAYLEDAGKDSLVDEVAGIEARLVTISRRSIDAKKVPGDLLSHLAERDLVSVKVAAAPVVPPEAVTVTTMTQLRVKRA